VFAVVNVPGVDEQGEVGAVGDVVDGVDAVIGLFAVVGEVPGGDLATGGEAEQSDAVFFAVPIFLPVNESWKEIAASPAGRGSSRDRGIAIVANREVPGDLSSAEYFDFSG